MNEIFDRTLGIRGFGIVGQSVLRFASSHGCNSFVIIDTKPEAELLIPEPQKDQVTFYLQTPDTIKTMLETCAFIVPSPGIDLKKEYSKKCVAELDIFQHYNLDPVIAITGSVGKTTVTTLLGSLLEYAGFSAVTAGNIGTGMLDLVTDEHQYDYQVLEVSSFQLEHAAHFRPTLAIITNIYPNHLDRHGTIREYALAKMNIIHRQQSSDHAILPWDQREVLGDYSTASTQKTWHSKTHVSADFIQSYTATEPLYALFNNDIVRISCSSAIPIISLAQLPDISLVQNWIILAAALETLGVNTRHLITPDMSLSIPDHRIEHVATHKGAAFYNDSKSTIPASTLAALEKLNSKQLILFIGGVSKGVNREPFIKELANKVESLYCFGVEAAQLTEYAHRNNVPAEAFENLEEAIEYYFRQSKANDCVLFSPSGASFDLFANYQKRGESFKKLIQKHCGIITPKEWI